MEFVVTIEQLESFVTVMSEEQYKKLELIAKRKEKSSSFTKAGFCLVSFPY